MPLIWFDSRRPMSKKSGKSEAGSATSLSEGPDQGKGMTDSACDLGYQSMSCSTATDISKSTCSFLDSGLIEEEPHAESESAMSKVKFDSGYCADVAGEASDKRVQIQAKLLHTPLSFKDIYRQNRDGDTLLHVACMEGWADVVWNFIRETPHPDLLDIKNDAGQASLHIAVRCGHRHIVRFLVVSGATIDARDEAGCTPLHLACRAGSWPLVQEFLSPITQEVDFLRLKYKVEVQNSKSQIEQLLLQRTYAGDTPFHLAVCSGSRELVEHLLVLTPDPNAQERYEGNTALHQACRMQREDLAELLLRSGRMHINAQNYAHQTALHSTWPLYRAQPHSKALLRIVMLLREHGGQPLQDPGSEDEDSYEEEDEEDEDEEEDEERNEEGAEDRPFRIITLLVNDTAHSA
ncbi:NF-kappa-B inhibitor alpha-like isoform X2 [Ornithodoros turicata]|uniref:NF-kappa-B inhibitor alpha-like isoform X2 n=1 Tax=Ornithodoros turicata TaxID=34597 RepID=UPI003138B902